MTTAVVTTSYPDGPGDPAGHFVQADARILSRGDRVVVVAPGSWADPREHALEVVRLGCGRGFGSPGVAARVRARPIAALDAATFVWRARRALARLRPDRVVAHWLLPCAWPIASVVDAPLTVVVHGSDARLLAALPGPVRRSVVRSLLARRSTFRFVSRESLDLVARAAGEEIRQCAVVEPSAIAVEGVPRRSDARRRLGVPEGRRLAVIVGRLVPGKRVDVALDAATSVAGLDVVVIGDGPEGEALRRRHPTVRFTGALCRDDALAWIAAADVLVTASRAEGAPTVVREARALGVPVVAVPSGDLPDWATRDPGIALASGAR